jgi:ankyrin repeat protein
MTPVEKLIYAAKRNDTKAARVLLGMEDVKNTAHEYDNLALQYAARNGNVEIVRRLLEIEKVKNAANANENNALRYAASNKHEEIVEQLLAIKVVREGEGTDKALEWTVQNNLINSLKLLLNIEVVSQNIEVCFGALKIGVNNKNSEAVELLLSKSSAQKHEEFNKFADEQPFLKDILNQSTQEEKPVLKSKPLI